MDGGGGLVKVGLKGWTHWILLVLFFYPRNPDACFREKNNFNGETQMNEISMLESNQYRFLTKKKHQNFSKFFRFRIPNLLGFHIPSSTARWNETPRPGWSDVWKMVWNQIGADQWTLRDLQKVTDRSGTPSDRFFHMVLQNGTFWNNESNLKNKIC